MGATLDSQQGKKNPDETPRGPLGDVRPDAADGDDRTSGGQPQEKVEDRPVVDTVKPEDYPEQQ
jgi:hypothetical protein